MKLDSEWSGWWRMVFAKCCQNWQMLFNVLLVKFWCLHMNTSELTQISQATWIVEYCWQATKINYILKFYLYLPKENKEKKNVEKWEKLLLTSCLRVCLSWSIFMQRCALTWVTKILMQAICLRGLHLAHGPQVPHPRFKVIDRI